MPRNGYFEVLPCGDQCPEIERANDQAYQGREYSHSSAVIEGSGMSPVGDVENEAQ
jgi:hypothetical protein